MEMAYYLFFVMVGGATDVLEIDLVLYEKEELPL
jgi:hypothetical protein